MSEKKINKLNLILKESFLSIPGVFNPFTALLAKKAGFKAIYLSGGALTSSLGIPDIGLLTLDEVVDTAKKIKAIVELPLIVDIDTGFGEPINVYRAVKALEVAGADAIHIEDQRLPKRCGHLDGKEVVDAGDMVKKIRAAIKARKEMLIIARTDARAVNGLEDAIKRANLYVKAGADMIFPEALVSEKEFTEFSKAVHAPLLANMTEFGKTPYINASTFQKMGYKCVIFPVTAFRAGAKAMEKTFDAIAKDGTQVNILSDLMTRSEQYDVINYSFYQNLDKDLGSDNK